MILAQLGTGVNVTDITPYINYTSYAVDSEPVYNEWVDANYSTHRDEVRRKIKGSFELAFTSDTDYNAFITLLNSNKAANLLHISLYVSSDINALTDCYVYYSIKEKSRKQADSGYIVTILEMSVEER